MTDARNRETVRRLYEDCLNARNYALLDELIGEDYHGIRGDVGPAGFVQTVKPIIDAFPDIQWTIEDLVAEADRVAVQWSWRGTHRATFRGLFPPTNRRVENSAIVIYELKEGRIAGARMQSDRLGFLQQIGAVPEDLRSLASAGRERDPQPLDAIR